MYDEIGVGDRIKLTSLRTMDEAIGLTIFSEYEVKEVLHHEYATIRLEDSIRGFVIALDNQFDLWVLTKDQCVKIGEQRTPKTELFNDMLEYYKTEREAEYGDRLYNFLETVDHFSVRDEIWNLKSSDDALDVIQDLLKYVKEDKYVNKGDKEL